LNDVICSCGHSIDRHGWAGCVVRHLGVYNQPCRCARKPSEIALAAIDAVITDEEIERLIEYLTAKHENAYEPTIGSIISTTILDTLLVVGGSLSVDDFRGDKTR